MARGHAQDQRAVLVVYAVHVADGLLQLIAYNLRR